MRRRALLSALPLVALPAYAQPAPGRHRVGVLTPSLVQWQPATFREAMRTLGYHEATNLVLVVRDAEGRLDRLPALAAELVRSDVAVIVAINTPGARAAIDATKIIPIVMTVVGDPVGTGLVSSLARPEGNATGISNLGRELTQKRLQLLAEAVSGLSRLAVLHHPRDPVVAPQIKDVTAVAAAQPAVDARFFPVDNAGDLAKAFEAMGQWRAQALLRLYGQAFALSAATIELAARYRLPAMMLTRDDVAAGALMAYDSNRSEPFRRAAYFVDRLLKGRKPQDLPIEQPTKFEFTINLKTASALGLRIPPALLALADEVIE